MRERVASPDRGSEERTAGLLVRLLLTATLERPIAGDAEWDLVLRLSTANAVLLRVAARLRELAVEPPRRFRGTAAQEHLRIRNAMDLMRALGRRCTDLGVAFLFPKSFQHYPDMGRDIDLLVLARPVGGDAALLGDLPWSRKATTVGNRLASTTEYSIRGVGSPLEIHHGRLGDLGEHARYPAALLARSATASIDGEQVRVPSPEDQLLLQGMQKVYARRSIRIADVVHAVLVLQRHDLDWDYLEGAAKRLGVYHGLSCYLSYVEQAHRGALGAELLSAERRERLTLDGWGPVAFVDGRYRFAALPVSCRLYAHELASKLLAAHWGSVGRFCLLPLAAVARARPVWPRDAIRGLSRPRRAAL
jgi:hypothetical protein